MADLLKLLRAYRKASTVEEGSKVGNDIAEEIYPLLHAFVFSQLRPPAAEDALQESLSGIFEGLSKVTAESDGQFLGWCYRITRRKIIDSLRKKYARREEPIAIEELLETVEAGGEKTSQSGARLDAIFLLDLIGAAKFPCDEVLWLYLGLGLEIDEIAVIYDVSYDASRMKIQRCLETARAVVQNLK